MDYAEILAAHDKLADLNKKLQVRVDEMKKSGMAMLESEMKRTNECLALRESKADLLAALQAIADIRRPQMCMDGSAVVGSPNATGYDFAMIARAAIAKATGAA